MKSWLIIFIPLCLSSCSSLYPIGGAIIGGAGGSVMGPAGAAVGSGAGAAAGQILAKEKDLEEAQETIKALTTGDVDKLVELRLQEAKEGGFFDSMLEGVYDFIKLVVLALVLWNVLPLVYTFLSNKKIHKKINGDSDGKNTSTS